MDAGYIVAYLNAYGYIDREQVRHVFFIAETKGTMNEMELRCVEKGKIACATKLFDELSSGKVVYHEVASFEDLCNLIQTL